MMGRIMHKRATSAPAMKLWVFILIAACLMVLMDRIFTSSEVAPENSVIEQLVNDIEPAPEAVRQILPELAPPLEFSVEETLMPEEGIVQGQDIEETPQWRRNAISTTAPQGAPRIVIIIDDMGVDLKHTRMAMDLPAPITFAFLPYATDLERQTGTAREKGHELIVHVPMEPLNAALNAGPEVLRPSMDRDEFIRVLDHALAAFDGYVGINNHMGSRMTQDRSGMGQVMAVLKERGLLFVDSVTIGNSVAGDEAEKSGIPHAARDVFLDHDDSYDAVIAALEQAERKALQNGLAIAIGHPKPATIRALQEWLPGLQERGIYLVPVSAAVTIPEKAE